MEKSAIHINNFVKKYGDFTAVDNVSFDVRQGEIFGLLGPNGAGKTSILESLEGLRTRTKGDVNILGIDPAEDGHKLQSLIGVQLQSSGLPESITPREAIDLFSCYHNVRAEYSMLKRFELEAKGDTQFHMLSGGQQRRLALVLATLHHPKVLILDEPTAALDVQSRVSLHELMLELRKQGSTILLATHDMAEAEKLADRVAVLLKGKLVALGTPKELTSSGSSISRISLRTSNNCFQKTTGNFKELTPDPVNPEYYLLFSTHPGNDVTRLISFVESQKDTLIDLRIERPSLEERFLELIRT